MVSITDSAGVTRISKVDPNDGKNTRDTKTFLMLSGVNHNLFGERDPKQYGATTLAQIEENLTRIGKELGVKIVCAQTNHEGEMVDLLQYARCLGGVIMNREYFIKSLKNKLIFFSFDLSTFTTLSFSFFFGLFILFFLMDSGSLCSLLYSSS